MSLHNTEILDQSLYADHDEMTGILKDNDRTPYYFLSLAIAEMMVKDNPTAANAYIEYTKGFVGKFYVHPLENDSLYTLCIAIQSLITLYREKQLLLEGRNG